MTSSNLNTHNPLTQLVCVCVCVLLTSVILRWSLVTELYSSILCLISSLLNSVRSSLSFSTSWRTEEKGKHDTISHKSTEIIQQCSVCQDNVQENVDESTCKNSSSSSDNIQHSIWHKYVVVHSDFVVPSLPSLLRCLSFWILTECYVSVCCLTSCLAQSTPCSPTLVLSASGKMDLVCFLCKKGAPGTRDYEELVITGFSWQ